MCQSFATATKTLILHPFSRHQPADSSNISLPLPVSSLLRCPSHPLLPHRFNLLIQIDIMRQIVTTPGILSIQHWTSLGSVAACRNDVGDVATSSTNPLNDPLH